MLRTKIVAVSMAVAAVLGGTVLALPASADNTAVVIARHAERSASHLRVFIHIKVACSSDTTSAVLTASVTQTTPAGSTQTVTGAVADINAYECTGDEEWITMPLRRPTGGYAWQAGTAAVRNVQFATQDPAGVFVSALKARTVVVS